MNQHLTEEQYQQAMARRDSGELRIRFEKQIARRFFTQMDNKLAVSAQVTSIGFKKLLIIAAVIAAPLVFLLSMSLTLDLYGPATARTVIPIIGICWTVLYGLTSHQGGWMVGSIPLFGAIIYFFIDQSVGQIVVLLALSIWLQRLTYLISSQWLIEIVAGSYVAFENLQEHIELIEN